MILSFPIRHLTSAKGSELIVPAAKDSDDVIQLAIIIIVPALGNVSEGRLPASS
jgi:hypothetical protein